MKPALTAGVLFIIAVVIYACATRYEITATGFVATKLDRWTGQSWSASTTKADPLEWRPIH